MFTYKAKAVAPKGLKITVQPTSIGQKLSFTVTLEVKIDELMVSASLVWKDGIYQVRIPIVVFVLNTEKGGCCLYLSLN